MCVHGVCVDANGLKKLLKAVVEIKQSVTNINTRTFPNYIHKYASGSETRQQAI